MKNKIMQGPRRKLHRQSNEKLKLMFSLRAHTAATPKSFRRENFHLTHVVSSFLNPYSCFVYLLCEMLNVNQVKFDVD